MTSLLPPAATDLERALAQLTARAERIQVPVREMWDPYECPAQLLPWLAWARGVVPWDDEWPEDVRREMIAAAIPTHRRAGTPWAMRRILGAMRVTLDVSEWWQQQPPGQPYTMALTAYASRHLSGDAVLSPELYRSIRAAVEATKPARVHYTLTVAAAFPGGLAAAMHAQPRALVRREADVAADTAQVARVGAALLTRPRLSVRRRVAPRAGTATGASIGVSLGARPLAVVRATMELMT